MFARIKVSKNGIFIMVIIERRIENKEGAIKDNIYIDMQAGRNLLPKLLVADN